jgi:hypothetical protein
MLPFGSFFEELDFGEDPPPPPQKRGPRIPGRGGGGGGDDYDEDVDEGPRRSGLGGGGVEVRRLALVAVAIVLVLVGGYWYVQRCQRNEEVSAYKSYVRDANAVSAQANKVAQKLQTTWLKQGQTPAQLQTDLNEIAKNQQAVVNAAEGLSSPGSMKELQRRYLEAQQLRLNGLTGVARQLPATLKGANGNIDTAKSAALSLLWLRIASGDVVFSDSFKGPAVKLLDDKNISGVALDDSQFIGPTLLSFNDPTKMQARLQTIVQGSSSGTKSAACQQDPNSDACKNSTSTATNCTGSCIHGTSIEATTINGTTLNRDSVTDVPTDPNNQNQIVVTIKNGGDFQETQVEASAFIDSDQVGDKAIIPVFDAGTTASVTFKFDPLFNKTKQSVKIVVKPVQGEENTANNSATYQVIFKLPT